MLLKRIILLLALSLSSISFAFSQLTNADFTGLVNTLSYQVPFLTLPTLAGNQSLGYIKSLSLNNEESGHFGNPSIMGLSGNKMSFTAGYTPSYRELMPGINLTGIAAYLRVSPKDFVGFDFTHFSLGEITYINQGPQPTSYKPTENAASLTYSRLINNNSSIGISIKYIISDLTGGQFVGGMQSRKGTSLATDISYSLKIPGKNEALSHEIGIGINNLGTKMAYQKNSDTNFIPTTLNLGYGANYRISQNQSLNLAYEVEKYLIPTPPYYYSDSLDMNGEPVIQKGFNPNVSAIKGMIRSFYDAPGGIQEELNETIHHFALGYSFKKIRFRSGMVLQHATKGNNKFVTVGIGISLRVIEINATYLIPFYQNSQLANTVGISAVLVI